MIYCGQNKEELYMEIQIKDNKIYVPLKDRWLVLKPEEEVKQTFEATAMGLSTCWVGTSYDKNAAKE